MSDWFTIVIPTRSSAAWIDTLIAAYRARGLSPVFLLDSGSTDATEAILAASGLTFHKIPQFPFTEAIVHLSRVFVPTPWALWIHDDEFPSSGLFARLEGPPPPDAATSVAIQRRWIWHRQGEPLRYGRSAHWHDRGGEEGADHVWRLFRPDRVEFVSVMHTEGFRIATWSRLPADCYIAHFEWVVRTRAQRAAKLRRYDAHRYGYGLFFRRLYLPEDQAPGIIDYRLLDTEEFNTLADAYHAARLPDAADPPLTLHERMQRARAWMAGLRGIRGLRREPKDRIGLTPSLENEIPDTLAD